MRDKGTSSIIFHADWFSTFHAHPKPKEQEKRNKMIERRADKLSECNTYATARKQMCGSAEAFDNFVAGRVQRVLLAEAGGAEEGPEVENLLLHRLLVEVADGDADVGRLVKASRAGLEVRGIRSLPPSQSHFLLGPKAQKCFGARLNQSVKVSPVASYVENVLVGGVTIQI